MLGPARGVNSSQNLGGGTNHTTAERGGGVVTKFSWAHRPSVLFFFALHSICVTQGAVYQGSLNQMLLLPSGKVRERSEQNFFLSTPHFKPTWGRTL